MSDPTPSEPEVQRRSRWHPRFSAAWLVPLIALALSLSVAWRTYRDRGPVIEILFESGSGIVAAETQLRFKDISVGTVESVDFTQNLSQVQVSVRLDKEIASYVDDSAKFWLVNAQVGPRGVTGLSTVLSGAYIEGDWDAEMGPRQTVFTALKQAPLTNIGEAGTHVRLSAPNGGSMAVGAPVLYKQIPVGTIAAVELTDAGNVSISAFVEAPHDRLLTTRTRFWNVSGFSVELGAAGAELRVDSLAALVQGGIAFDTLVSGGEPVTDDHVFQLYASESAAKSGVLSITEGSNPVTVTAVFDGSVEGLTTGADVRLRGIPVGEVSGLQAQVVDADGGPKVELEATLELVPERLGITDSDDPEAATLDLLAAGVRRGMRAKLAREGLLRPSLFVDIVEDPEADPGEFDRDADPFPVVPTVPPESSDLLGSAEGVMQRVAALPIEDIMQSVLTVLANVNALIASEKVQSIPADVGQAVDDLRALIGSEELQQAPAELTAILRSVRAVIDEVTTEQLVTSLAAAVEDARGAIQNVGAATEGLPDLLDQIEGLTGEVRTLPLDQMVETATDMVASVDALVQSEAVAGLPAEVEGAIGDVRLILQDLRTGGAITNVSATLASLRQITDEVAAAEITAKLDGLIADVRLASGNLSTASEDLPQLLDSLTTLSDEAATLPLDELVASAAGVMDSASAFLGSEGVEGVAPQLSAALQEFQLLLAELREGGAAQNVNATLASADKAAQAVADASAELPALVEQLDRAASTATATLTSVGPGSQLNRDTTQLINELRSAARSVDSLASALERRPNSVLFGR